MAAFTPLAKWWNDQPLGTKGLVVVALPVLALLVAGGSFFWLHDQESEAEQTVRHAYEVRSQIEELYSLVLSAENSVSGYVLAGNADFLGPYHHSLGSLPATLTKLQGLVVDAGQAERARQAGALVERRLELLAAMRAARPLGPGGSSAPPQDLLKKGVEATTELRRLLEEMEIAVDLLLAERTARAHQAGTRLTLAVAASFVFGILGGLLAVVIFTSGISRRMRQVEGDARRLSRGEALAPRPHSHDEIGQVQRELEAGAVLLADRGRQLSEAKDFLERLILFSPGVIFRGDPTDRLFYISPNLDRLLGYMTQEVQETPNFWVQHVHPEDREGFLAGLRDAREAGEEVTLRYRFLMRSGEYRRLLTVARTERGSAVLGYTQDVTSQVLAEEALRDREEKFRGLLEAAPAAVVGVDGSGRIVQANAQTENLFGYRREELLGQPVEILVPERFAAAHGGHRHGYFADPRTRPMGTRLELNARRKDGSEFPVEIGLSTLETAEGTVAVAIIYDVTERRRAQDQLRESAAFLNNVLESSTEYSIIATDLDGGILTWNAGAQRNYGYSAEEMAGKGNWKALFVPEDLASGRVEATVETALATGKVEGTRERVRRSGQRFHVSEVLTVRRNPAGEPAGFLLISKDITHQRILEEQLRRRNRELRQQYLQIQIANRLKSEFLANMSHELRTPLNAIIGFTELMHDGKVGPVSARHKEFLNDVLISARHLLQLINDVLDLSKIEAGKMEFHPEPVEMAKLALEVSDILRTLAAGKRIRMQTDIDAALSGVVLDAGKCKQVLYNYVSNALKFTPEGGQVTIRAKPEGAEAIRLEVEDTGIGIRPEDIGKLFREFQQLDAGRNKQYPGTGLGLALTKRIVEAQGGQVGVVSAPGQGSVFSAILPRTPKSGGAPKPQSRPLPSAASLPGAPTVLVIEDDADDCALLVEILSDAGYAVETAATGAEAVEQCGRRAFDAITLDLLLPDINGWDVLRVIRTDGANRDTPVVVVTVVAPQGIALSFPVHCVLTKPIQPQELLASLDQLGLKAHAGSPILVVDDNRQDLKLAEVTLEQLGFRAICREDAESGLRAAADEKPAAVVLDLLMPDADGFEFLRRLRSTPAGRRIPVIVWTGKDLTDEDQAQLRTSVQAVVSKGNGGTDALLEEIRACIGPGRSLQTLADAVSGGETPGVAQDPAVKAT